MALHRVEVEHVDADAHLGDRPQVGEPGEHLLVDPLERGDRERVTREELHQRVAGERQALIVERHPLIALQQLGAEDLVA